MHLDLFLHAVDLSDNTEVTLDKRSSVPLSSHCCSCRITVSVYRLSPDYENIDLNPTPASAQIFSAKL